MSRAAPAAPAAAPTVPAAVPRLGDLLDVPEIRTVVKLSDAADPGRRQELAGSFVMTETVRRHLEAVLAVLARGEGAAGFVVGNYGTGKSHLLALLSALASDPEARRSVARTVPDLGPLLAGLEGHRPLVVRLSFLDYPGRAALDDLVLGAWAEAVGVPPPLAGARTGRADELLAATRLRGHGVVLLLLDELSEFLRSKLSAAAFTEDVRTLQLLGELAADRPLLVLGALQEQIESAGDLSPETLNKIKDRYRLRLHLRAEHLEQIVATRLLRRRPGADPIITRLARRVREALPDLSIPQDRLERLWPVHPATLAWLDELREFFSRQRGALDFVCAQLRGDPTRNQPGRLDRPADELLTPDALYDHFIPRIVEEPALRPYHDVVFGWWEREGRAALPEALRSDATRALKLLLLAGLSPARRPLGAARVAESLLLCRSRIDPAANRRYAAELLAALSRAGTFVRPASGGTADDPAYEVDFRADASLAVNRRLVEEERRLSPDDRRPFWQAAQWTDGRDVPLDTLLLGRKLTVRWQNTGRTLDVQLVNLDEVTGDELGRLLEDLASAGADGVLLMAAAAGLPAQQDHLREVITPRLRQAPGRLGFGVTVLLPAPLPEEAQAGLHRAYALAQVATGLRGDESEGGRAARVYLESPFAEARRRAHAALAVAYSAGEVHGADGLLVRLGEQGPFDLERLAATVIDKICAGRFPRHAEVRPGSDGFGVEALEGGLTEFVRAPEGHSAPLSPLARRVVQDLYLPLGLARFPRGARHDTARPTLEVNPGKNPAVAEALDAVRRQAAGGTGRAATPAVERDLRTGPFGFSPPQLRALLLALISTGHVTAYVGGRARRADEVNALALRQVTELGLGEVVDPELWRRVTALPFVPARFRGVAPNVPLQTELADALGALRGEVAAAAEGVRRALERCRGYRSLAGADLGAVARDAEACLRLGRALGEDGPSGAAGVLQAVESACRAEPELSEALRRTRARAVFFTEKLDPCVRMHDYLHHPDLRVPEDGGHELLRSALDHARRTLAEEAAVLGEDFGARSSEAFEAFRTLWAERYLREHGALSDDPRFADLEGLRGGEAHRLLARLSDLPGVSAEHDKVAVERVLAAARARRCTRLRPETLHQRPLCVCGFRLGNQINLPTVGQVEEQILVGLRELLLAVVRGPLAERLRAAAAGCRAVGRELDGRAMLVVAERSPPGPEASVAEVQEQARAVLAVEPLLREALYSPIEVLERDGNQLLGRLAGRTLTVAAVRDALEAWLAAGPAGGAAGGATYVHVASSLLAPADALLRVVQEQCERRFPELGALTRRPEELLVLAALARSARDHGAAPGRWAPLAGRDDLGDRAGALADLGAALLDECPEGTALAARASDLLEPVGIDELSRALVPEDGLAGLVGALAVERTLPALLRSLARRFLRAAETSAGLLPEPPVRPAPGPVTELAAELLGACAARTRLRAAALAAVTRLAPGQAAGARTLTNLYTEQLFVLERDRAAVNRLAARHDLLDPAGRRALAREATHALETAERATSVLLAERYAEWQEDARGGPTFLARAVEAARGRVKTDLGLAPAALVLVDALRWDVWQALKSRLEAGPPGGGGARLLRVTHEAAAWAHRPTDTATNLAALRGLPPPPASGCPAPGGRADSEDPLLGRLVHLRSLDLRVHHAREAPDLLCEEAAAELHREIAALADALPARSALILLADHGFVESRDFDPAQPHARARYRHGGDSLFELVVPVAVVLRL